MCLVLELGISSNTELGISLQPHPLTRFGALTLCIHRHWLSHPPAAPRLPLRRHGSALPGTPPRGLRHSSNPSTPPRPAGGRAPSTATGRGAVEAIARWWICASSALLPPRGLRRSSTPSIEGGRAPRRRGPRAAELPPRRRGEARWRPSRGGGSAQARPSSLLAPPRPSRRGQQQLCPGLELPGRSSSTGWRHPSLSTASLPRLLAQGTAHASAVSSAASSSPTSSSASPSSGGSGRGEEEQIPILCACTSKQKIDLSSFLRF